MGTSDMSKNSTANNSFNIKCFVISKAIKVQSVSEDKKTFQYFPVTSYKVDAGIPPS